MIYELWDTETSNLIDTFESESEALEAVRELATVNRPAYPAALGLACEGADGRMRWLATGNDLASRAEAAA
jgi:hypothetical protein